MGALISRWRKKETTIETLEKLEKEITTIESQRKSNQESERRIVGSLLMYSASLYIVFTAVFYFYYLPEAWVDRMKYSIPLVSFPAIIWGLKRFLHWYFVKRITKNETKLEMYMEQKKSILNEVMEKETYKKAKEILERFDSKKLQEAEMSSPVQMKAPPGHEFHPEARGIESPTVSQTSVGPVPKTPAGVPVTTPKQPGGGQQPGTAGRPVSGQNMGQQAPQWENSDTPSPTNRKYRRTSNQFGTPMRPPGPPMPRSILPRDRTTSERILEYLIGDGPQNRYALICKKCFSHNGMAYKEEFDYLNFRCCYCYTFNKASKQRPSAPKLETPPTARRTLNINQEPESGTDAECDSEDATQASQPITKEQQPENIAAGTAEAKKDK